MIEEREELTGELIASGEVIASLIATKGAKGDKGDKGDTGNPGADGSDGADGISPIITTSKSDKTTTITIVDAEGTKTATIVDGENGTDGQDGADGQDGQDGFSPIANVTKSGDTATISITDANGTTTASISDGADGADGADGSDGQDGFSPIANVSKSGKIATITITDSLGTTTAEIRDGEDGQGSGDMLKSTYDTNNNGIVDNAELVNSHTVLSDVPANAVFTDTTYTAGTGIDITAGVISNTQTSAEWGNISGTLADQTDLNTALGNKADSSSLAAVATSGDYTDLSNTPTIPTKVSDLTNDSGFISGLVEMTYGTSTWADFLAAYNAKKLVYCNANGTRMAFMAYVSVSGNTGSVEFQYYKSNSTHSDSSQGDKVFVYKLTSSNGGTWTTEERNTYTKIKAGEGLTSSYSSETLILKNNRSGSSIPQPYSTTYAINLFTMKINNENLSYGYNSLRQATHDAYTYYYDTSTTTTYINDFIPTVIYINKKFSEASTNDILAIMSGYKPNGSYILWELYKQNSTTIAQGTYTATDIIKCITDDSQTIAGEKTFSTIPKISNSLTLTSDYQLAHKKYVDDGLSDKQDTLVSGTSIKTINSTSLLGSGNIALEKDIPIQGTAPVSPEENDLWIDTSAGEGTSIVDLIFPVGSIVIKADNNDYSHWLGFTWERTLVGRVAVGIDSTQTEFDTIGETGGEKKHTLTIDEMPSHSHKLNQPGSGGGNVLQFSATINEVYSSTNMGTYDTGGGQAHNILQPYQVVAYWKRIS